MEPTSSTLNHHHHHYTAVAPAMGGAGIRWNSPIPYLFGGMAIVLMLIAMALIILACAQDKNSDDDKENDAAGKASKAVDDGPKFVVIMAGAHKPTFLAKPVPKPKPEPKPESVIVPIGVTSTSSTTTTSIHSPPIGDEQV